MTARQDTMTAVTSAYVSRTASEPRPVRRLEPVIWGDPDAGPTPREELDRYEEEGFLLLESFLDPRELAELDVDLDRIVTSAGVGDDRIVREPGGDTVRSVFQIHELSERVAELASDPRLLGRIEQIIGSAAYLHQSRVNFKPGLRGKEFYWHSDFETWHFEDGMPEMRAVSVSINLTENRADNGSLMIMAGSHRVFVGCVGATPEEHYRRSLRAQHYGVPSDEAVTRLAEQHGIVQITAPAGSALLFDSNCMHGSNGNITPFARRNLFLVFNSVENTLMQPVGGTAPRPGFVASRNPARLG